MEDWNGDSWSRFLVRFPREKIGEAESVLRSDSSIGWTTRRLEKTKRKKMLGFVRILMTRIAKEIRVDENK